MHALLGQLVVQTDRLRDLADQLLDLSRIESGGAAGPPERFDPSSGSRSSCRGSPATAPPTCASWSSPAGSLVADPVAFERVAANLILNALRYGEPPVEVRVEASRSAWCRGPRPGVAPEFVPRLFERFSRSDESRRSAAPGSGLGLAIAVGLREGARRRARLRAGAAARRALHAVATGSSKLKREPSPSRDSTQIVPFIRRTSSREM